MKSGGKFARYFLLLFCLAGQASLAGDLSWLRDEPFYPGGCEWEIALEVRRKKELLARFREAYFEFKERGRFRVRALTRDGRERLDKGEDVVTEQNAFYYDASIINGILNVYHPTFGVAPFDSESSRAFTDDHIPWAMFAMNESGKIRVSNYRKYNVFHHSGLFAGEPVGGVGGMRARAGKVNGLSNGSGHYLPEVLHLAQALVQCYLLGVLESEVEIRVIEQSKETVFPVTLEELSVALK